MSTRRPTASRKSKGMRVSQLPQVQSDDPDDPELAELAEAAEMQPDYKFPVIFYVVTHELLTEIVRNAPPGNNNLNEYINVQTQQCFTDTVINPATPFVSTPRELCFLFMRWNARHHLETIYSTDLALFYRTINDYTFLNKSILGHAKIVERNEVKHLGIYSVCKHEQMVMPDLSVRPRDIDIGKIGIDMFTALLTGVALVCSTLIPVPEQEATTLWLGIDLSNPDFDKVAYIYTICGFSNPIISNLDYLQQPIGHNVLQLTRPLLAHASSHLKTRNNFNQVMNLKHNFSESSHLKVMYNRVSSHILKYRFSFDRSCISSLHLFPFLSFNDTNRVVGLHTVDAQRETGGKFVVASSIYAGGEGHDVFILETIDVSPTHSFLKYNVGTSGEVIIPNDEATFHTHPITNYFQSNVIIGTPSEPDFTSFVMSFIYLQLTGAQSYKFSVISTVEGVYIISLHPNGIKRFFDMAILCINLAKSDPSASDWTVSFRKQVVAITNEYEYRISERSRDIQTGIQAEVSQVALQSPIAKYMRWFDTVNRGQGAMFELEFFSWDEFTSADIFEVTYLENRIKIYI